MYVQSEQARLHLIVVGIRIADTDITVHENDPHAYDKLNTEKITIKDLSLNMDNDVILNF